MTIVDDDTSGLTYSAAPSTLTVGTSITALTATATGFGGATVTYSVTSTAKLPAGLNLNTSTGAITGVPTTASTSTATVTVSATSGSGDTAKTATADIAFPAVGKGKLATPTNLAVKANSKTRTGFTVTWDTVANATGYTATARASGQPDKTVTLSTAPTNPEAVFTGLATDTTYTVTVIATGNLNYDNSPVSNGQSVTTLANSAPTVANAIADQTATVGVAFSYAFPANSFADTDSDSLTYTATRSDDSALPTWLTFTASERKLAGTPQSGDTGTLMVRVTASDGMGGSVSDTFNIVVSAAVVPSLTYPALPTVLRAGVQFATLTPESPANFAAGSTFTYEVTAGDLPSGLELNANTGAISGTPDTPTPTDGSGGASVTVTVTGTTGTGDNVQTETATVTLNFPRIFRFKLPAPTVTLAVGDTQLTANWEVVTNAGTYALQWKASSVTSWTAATGVTTVDPATPGTVITGLTNGTTYDVRVRSKATPGSTTHTDGDWSSATQAVPTADATFSVTGPATVAEDAGTATYTVTLSAQPAASVTVDYATADGTATAGSDYTAASGTLTFAPTNWDTAQTVAVTISNDTVDDDDETFTFTLSNAGTGSMLSASPTVTTTITDNDVLGLTYTAVPSTLTVDTPITALTTTATGFGSVTITYSVTTGTLPAGLDISATTGDITGTPTAASTSTTTVTVTATAGTGMDTQTATVSITFPAVGKATLATPTNLALKANTQRKTGFTVSWTAVENATDYTATASASGETDVTVTLSTAPANPEAAFTGLTAGTDYTVTVVAKGNANYNDSTAATLSQATAANAAPSITDITNKTATFGTNLLVDVDATDTNPEDTLQYQASSGATAVATVSPTSLTDLGANSQITVTPVAVGTATITVTVSDGTASPTDTFVVTVGKATLATPTNLALKANTQRKTGFTVTWTAVENATGYTATATPSGGTAVTGTVTGTEATFTGLTAGTTYTVSVVATGNTANYESSTAAMLSQATAANAAPSITDITNKTATFGTNLLVDVDATDTNPEDTLQYQASSGATAVATVTPTSLTDLGTNSQITVTPVGAGTATITVTVSDGTASPTDTFVVTVSRAQLGTPVVAVSAQDGELTVTWVGIPNAASYEVEYKQSTSDTWLNNDDDTSPAEIDSLTNGTEYDVRVRAKAAAASTTYADSTWSGVVKGTPTAVDVAPSFGSETVAAQTWAVGTNVDLTLPVATGGNGTISYALTPALPSGVTLNSSTRVISGVPTAVASAATYTWRAADGDSNTANSDTAALTFQVTVGKGTLATPTGLTLKANTQRKTSFTVSWTAVANATGYTATATPSGGTAVTGTVDTTGTNPEAAFTGLTAGTTYDVSVVATGDTANYEASTAATLSQATAANAAPSITDITDKTATFGTNLLVDVDATDTNPEDTLQYRASSGATAVATVSPTSLTDLGTNSQITVTPVAAGTATITVTVSDGTASPTDTFVVTVGKATLATPTGLTLKANTQRKTGFTVTWTAVANATGYTATATPSGGTAVTGTVDTTGTNPEAAFTGLTAGTTYTVSVVATGDTANYENSTAATLSQATAANAAPSIVDITNKTATFGTNLLVDVDATDTNPEDTLQYQASSSDAAVATVTPTSLTDLGANSQVTVTPVAAGTATITVTVSDGTASPTDTFVVTVSRTQLGTPVVTVSAQDGKLTASWVGITNAASYEVEYKQSTSDTWLNNDDDTSPAEIDSLTNGTEYDVRVRAKAASSSTTYEDSAWSGVVKGTPTAVDVAPSFGSETVAAQTWTVGTNVDLTLPVATGGNGTISYELTPALPSGVTLNSSTRVISGAPTAVASAATYTWRAADSDSNTADSDTAALTFSVTVGKGTLATPTNLALKANTQRKTGFTVSWTAVENATGYTATATPSGGTAVTGTVDTTGTNPEAAFTGLTAGTDYTVSVVAKGNANYNDSTAATLDQATAANAAPSITDITDKTVTFGTNLLVDVDATDTNPEDTLQYQASSSATAVATVSPTSLTDLDANSQITVTPVAAGTATITVTVSDGTASPTDTFVVTVGKATLATPTNLAVKANTQRKTSFTVTWTAVTNATGYTATATPSGGIAVTGTVDTTGTNPEAAFTGLTAGTAYSVSVVATGDTANYENSTAATLSQATAANAAPSITDITNETATFGTNLMVDVDATDTNPEDTLQYQASSSATAVATVSPTSLTDLDANSQITVTPVAVGTATITVTVSDGTASPTDTFVVTVGKATLTTPTGLAVKANTLAQTGFTVTWTAVTNATGYTATATPSGGTAVTGTVAGTEATFTGLTANTTYTVSVTATGNANYNNSAAETLSVTTLAAQGLSLSTTTLTVNEGATGTYTVALASQPSAAVTVAVAGSGDVTVSPASLTFTTDNWDDAQTVTVSAAEDDDAGDDTAEISHTASGGGYGSVTGSVSVTVDDDDTRGVTLDKTALTILEGSSGTYTVVLDTQPTDDVTVTVGGASGDVSVSTTSLTFTSSNWNTAQTVTVTAAEDEDAANDAVVTLTHAVSGADYASETAPSVVVTITEKDAATFSVTGPTSIGEGAGTATYTVSLSAQPGDDVTVKYATSDGTATAGSDYTAASGTLTFTTVNWNTAQTVEVAITDDTVDDDDETFTFTLSEAGTGSMLSASPSITTTITDDDDPAVTVFFGAGTYSVTEGGTVNVAVTLSADPERSVEIPLTTTNGTGVVAGDYSGVPASVTFASGETSKTVTFSATDDSVDESDETVTLGFGASLPTRVTAGTTAETVVTITDNDTSGLTYSAAPSTLTVGTSITALTATATGFGGATVTYSVTVGALPAGLGISASTGEITGMPTTASTSTATVTVSATSGSGDTAKTATVNITFPAVGKATLATPTNLAVKANTLAQTGFTVSWTAVANAAGYTATATPSGGTAVTGTVDTSGTTPEASFTGLTANTTYTVSVTATGNANYNNSAAETLSVTTLATQGLSLSTTTLTVNEGATGTYTVALASQPSAAVTVAVAGSGDVTVSPASLTFTTDNWDDAQTVTVSAAEDDDAGDDTAEISHTASGGGYGSVTGSVSVTVDDDDTRGVTLDKTALTILEGSSGTYTVVLDTQPTDDVTVTVGGASGDVSVSTTSLTFTSSNWNTAQTVTVTAAEDEDAANDAVVTLTHAVSGADYASETAPSVVVTITEKDAATFSVTGPTSIGEGAGTATYTVSLSAQPGDDVTVKYATSDGTATAGSDYTAASGTLTFTTVNWNTAQTVEVTITDDTVDDDDETFTFTLSEAGTGSMLSASPTVTTTITDNDVPTVTVFFGAGTYSVTEGGTVNVAVTLSADPERLVAIPLTTTNGTGVVAGDYSGVPASVTFASGETSKTVVFSATDDSVDESDETVTLGFGTSLPTRVTAGTTAETVVTIVDDDTSGLTYSAAPSTLTVGTSITALTATATGFGGATVTYSVTVGALPAGLGISASTGEITGMPTTASTSTATVTVSATSGSGDTAKTATVNITFPAVGKATLATPTNLAVKANTLAQTGFTVSWTAVANAAGYTATATPSGGTAVTGTVDTSGTTPEASFTGLTANTTYTVSVTATGNANYNNSAAETLSVTTLATQGLSLSTTTLTVNEGATGTYTVALASQPSAAVTVAVAGSGDVTVSPASLTFTTDNWDTAQSVTVSAAEDDDAGDDTAEISHTASGGGYGSVTGSVSVTVGDDDTRGVTLDKTALTILEGSSGTYTVVLDTQPTDDVTVTVGGASGDVSVSTTSLTFTSSNWNTAQTVTVTAAEDEDAANDAVVTLTHAVSGADYASETAPSVVVTITEKDAATFSVTGPTSIGEGAGTATYTVSLSAQPGDDVTVKYATSDGTATAGSDYTAASGTLTFTTVNWNTAQTVEVTITDDTVDDDDETFTFTLSEAGTGSMLSASPTVTTTITDNDVPTVTVFFGAGTYSVTEGGTVNVAVTLSADPERLVAIPLTTTNGTGVVAGDYSGVPASVTFASGETSKTVVFSATDDSVDESDETVTLGFGTSLPTRVTAGTTAETVVTIVDDDTSGLTYSAAPSTLTVGTSITALTATATGFGGATVTYSVTVGALPAGLGISASTGEITGMPTTASTSTATVTVSATSGSGDTARTATASITFPAVNKATLATPTNLAVKANTLAQTGFTVSWTAVANAAGYTATATPSGGTAVTGTVDTSGTTPEASFTGLTANTTYTVSVTATGNANYNNSAAETLSVTTLAAQGLSLSTTTLTVNEGATGTYTVALASQPSAAVTVAVAGSGDVTVSPASLTFTTDNWDDAQTVTVSAAEDDDAGDDTAEISHTASGGGYGSVTGSVSVTVDDDDTRGVTLDKTALTILEGSSGTYTVVLDTQPTDDVTVTVGGASGDVSVSTTSLTFTSSNWNTAQTVTVTAAEDEDAANDAVVTLTHAVSGADYASETAPSVVVTITEKDAATFSVTGPTSIGEGAGTATYTVSLSAQPGDDVTVKYATSDGTATAGSDYTAASGTLTFTTVNWNTAQTVEVTITDDTVDDDDETFTFTLSEAGTGSMLSASPTVTTTITDNDVPTVTVFFGAGTYSVTEGGTVNVAVTLSADPERLVAIPLTTTNGTGVVAGDYSGVPASVTFASGETSKTVVFSATDDSVDESDETVTLGFGTSLPTRVTAGTTAETVVTIVDDDTSGLTYSAAPSTLTVGTSITALTATATGFGGATVTYSVTVGALPAGLGISASTGEITGMPTTASTSTATVTVSATSGSGDTAKTATVNITFPAVGKATLATPTNLAVKANTLAQTGFTVSWTAVANAAGYTATATPSGGTAVTGTVDTSGTTPEASFTGLTANTTYTVSVTATGNANYNNSAAETLSVTTLATQGLSLSTTTLTVNEGATGTYTVALASQPSAAVTVAVAGSGDVTVSPASLTFTTDNWDTAQSVTVSAAEDDDAGDDTAEISHTASGGGYGSVTGSVSVTVGDDDTRGVTISETALTILEGSSGTYTVVLDTQPTDDVTVTVGGASGDVSVSTTSLTFTSSNWNTAQTVTVTAAEDEDAANDAVVTLTHAVSGADYASETAPSVVVTITEKDAATFSVTGPTSIGEGAGTATYTVSLSAQPGDDVTVKYATSDGTATAGSDYTAASGTLTFTTVNWNTAQTVEVTITDDTVDDDDETFTFTLSEAGTGSMLSASPTVTTTITDNDVPTVTVFFGAGTYSVTEGGTVNVAVTLSADPERLVAIPLTTTNGTGVVAGDYSGVPASVTFASGETSKTVVFSATDDSVDESDETVTLGFGTSLPTRVTAGTTAETVVTIVDDDTSGLTYSAAPSTLTVGTSITALTATATGFGGATVTYSVTVGALPAGLGISASTGEITGMPTTASTSTATVTVSATSGSGDTARTATASITFPAVNKATLATPTNLAVKANTLAQTGFTVSWTAVANAAGYTATATPSGGTAVTGTVTGTEAAFTGLTANTAYTVSITATGNTNYNNSVAETLSVTTLEEDTAPITPTEVSNLQVSAGDGSLLVSWTAASSAPNGYSVRWRERGPGNALSPVNEVDGTSFTISDLTNGQEYVVRVETRNATDTGVQVGTVVTITGTPVEADTAPAFAQGTTIPAQIWTVGTPVNLTLPEATGGDGTLSYTLTPALPAGVTLNTLTRVVSGTPTSATSTTAYTWRTTDSDSDTAALFFSVTVDRATLPSPMNLAVKPDTQTRNGFTVTWNAVANATGYTATATPSGGTAVTGSVTGTEAAFTGLTANTTYTVSITAIGNANYNNSRAETLSVTTLADTAPAFAQGTTIPAQIWTVDTPVNLTLPEATGGDGTLSYTLTPALPAGVTLNTLTRVVSGTPTSATSTTAYTWRTTDSDSDTAALFFQCDGGQGDSAITNESGSEARHADPERLHGDLECGSKRDGVHGNGHAERWDCGDWLGDRYRSGLHRIDGQHDLHSLDYRYR